MIEVAIRGHAEQSMKSPLKTKMMMKETTCSAKMLETGNLDNCSNENVSSIKDNQKTVNHKMYTNHQSVM